MTRRRIACVALAALVTGWFGELFAAAPIVFEDVTQRLGIKGHVQRWRFAHGGAWGDANGDGRPDLYIGAFADRFRRMDDAPLPNQLFLNSGRGFVLSKEKAVRLDNNLFARTASSIFVDLDNDGDLDLFVATHGEESRDAPVRPQSVLFENVGGGRFRDVTPQRGDWPRPLGARNVGALDVDDDGLLDLVICDGNYSNWEDGGGRLILLRNKGDWTFEYVDAKLGLPQKGVYGMGLAMGDVNDDGAFDFFVADCNRMFVSGPDGKYRECQPGGFVLAQNIRVQKAKLERARKAAEAKARGEKPDTGRGRRGRGRREEPQEKSINCVGAAFGDLNGDGLLDMVVTEHVPGAFLHVYLNTGIDDGVPKFVEVSKQIGLDKPFPKEGVTGVVVKSGHVAIRDVDNDGRNDIMLALIYKAADGAVQPLVLQNLGNKDGLPQLKIPPLERFIGYYAPAPVADYDRDGRVDIFMPSWFWELPNYLFRNVTDGGHWLTVRVAGKGRGVNPMGIGATVRAYKAGHAGDAKHLIQRFDIALGTGYSSGEEALAHIGLGDEDRCDVEVTWGRHKVIHGSVAADQAIEVTVTAP